MDNTTANGGFWMMIEDDCVEETREDITQPTKEQTDKYKDGYEFYPDASF